MHSLLTKVQAAAVVASVTGALVVAATTLVAVNVGHTSDASQVHAGNVADLAVGVPYGWEGRFWLIRDGFGDVHAFPTEYDSPVRHRSPVVWLPAADNLASIYLQRDACAKAAGDGIFNVLTPANSRYDAAGHQLMGPDRPRLDSYLVRVSPHGDITVDTGKLQRTERPTDANTDGLTTPTPAVAPFTATPSASPKEADCRRE